MDNLNINYTFEKTSNGNYQVRLCGEFVCFSNHTDEKIIDIALKDQDFETREEFLKYCHEEAVEFFSSHFDH